MKKHGAWGMGQGALIYTFCQLVLLIQNGKTNGRIFRRNR